MPYTAFDPQQRDPVPIVQEAGWALEMVCLGIENSTLMVFKSWSVQWNAAISVILSWLPHDSYDVLVNGYMDLTCSYI